MQQSLFQQLAGSLQTSSFKSLSTANAADSASFLTIVTLQHGQKYITKPMSLHWSLLVEAAVSQYPELGTAS